MSLRRREMKFSAEA